MTARRQTSIKVDPVAWDEAKEIFKKKMKHNYRIKCS